MVSSALDFPSITKWDHVTVDFIFFIIFILVPLLSKGISQATSSLNFVHTEACPAPLFCEK
jgi:hypothetical protein